MSFMKILEFTAEVGMAYLQASHFRQRLDAPRPEAMAHLERQVDALDSHQLDAYEADFPAPSRAGSRCRRTSARPGAVRLPEGVRNRGLW